MRPFHFQLALVAGLIAGLGGPLSVCSAAEKKHQQPATTDPANAGPDYAVQGEYAGSLQWHGSATKIGVQVVALGEGKFDAVLYAGGLPGDGWKKGEFRETATGKTEGDATNFKSDKWTAKLAGSAFTVMGSGGESLGSLTKVERKSPTLGEKPPAGATVLFDGSSADHFKNGKIVEGDLLAAGTKSIDKFQDFKLHLEFRTPFMPAARGQGRGNSGVYLQDRYELQVLDSFGLEGLDNECGGIYHCASPAVNMCLPPLTWQTYDVNFTAARFEDKKKVKDARVTIKHNGVVIHDDLDLPHESPGGQGENPDPGPLQFQMHGNPVTYRNIWVVPSN